MADPTVNRPSGVPGIAPDRPLCSVTGDTVAQKLSSASRATHRLEWTSSAVSRAAADAGRTKPRPVSRGTAARVDNRSAPLGSQQHPALVWRDLLNLTDWYEHELADKQSGTHHQPLRHAIRLREANVSDSAQAAVLVVDGKPHTTRQPIHVLSRRSRVRVVQHPQLQPERQHSDLPLTSQLTRPACYA